MTADQSISLADLTSLIEKVGPTVYGFVVSQEVYDGLRARISQKFTGENCVGSTPIVVDPKLSGAECEAAFTAAAWQRRIREITEA